MGGGEPRYLRKPRSADRRWFARSPSDRWAEFNRYGWSSHRAYAGLEKPAPWLSLEWLWLFETKARAAQKEYREYIRRAFGQIVESPWDQLRGGLVLGSETLWSKVAALVEGGKSDDALRWSRREKRRAALRGTILGWIDAEADRRVQVWLRVSLGGARRIDVARELGYADGSAITQLLKRMAQRRKADRTLDRLLTTYADRFVKCQGLTP